MPKNRSLKIAFMLGAGLILLIASQIVLAHDGRINQVHHFGGDALYCNQDRGCWLLNMNGQLLWEVAQAAINDAMAVACETGTSQFIQAGMGTYGPSVIRVSCYVGYDPFLTYSGYDEWGKLNEMRFPANYEPVNAPTASEPESDSTPASPCPATPLGLIVPMGC